MLATVGACLRKLRHNLGQSVSLGDVAVLAGGTAFAQAVAVLSTPILTRLYTPDDFGVLGVYVSILGILVVVASLSYHLAIPLPEDEEVANNLLVLCFLVILVTTTICGTAVWVSYSLGRGLEKFLPVRIAWFLPAGLALAGSYQALTYWAVRHKAFGLIARTKLGQGISSVAAQIITGLLHFGPLGLVIGYILSQSAGIMSLGLRFWRSSRASMRKIRWVTLKAAAARYRRFPLIRTWDGLLGAAGLQLPTLILSAFFEPRVVGLFVLSERLIGIPLVIGGQSIGQVFLAEAARLVHSDTRALLRLFNKLSLQLIAIGTVPCLILLAIDPGILRAILGQEWGEAARVVKLLAPLILARFVVVPLRSIFDLLERQEFQLAWDVLRLLATAGILFLGATTKNPYFTILLYSVGLTGLYAVLYLAYRAVLKQTVAKQCARKEEDEGCSD